MEPRSRVSARTAMRLWLCLDDCLACPLRTLSGQTQRLSPAMADHDETQKIEEDQGFTLEALGEKAEYHAFNALCTSAAGGRVVSASVSARRVQRIASRTSASSFNAHLCISTLEFSSMHQT
jgi:hypothetical protein